MNMEKDLLRKILEGAILAAGQPLTVVKLQSLFEEEDETPSKEDIQAALEDIQADCQERGYELKEVATGWRFQVRDEMAPWVGRLWDERPQKYSRALLETLALIAYRQPITRGDIEEIRGVAVSSHIIKTLTERDWIKVVGHRDVPGRPSLYATTKQFLAYFNLKSLEELPTLGDIRDLEDLNKSLDLGEREMEAVKAALAEEKAAADDEGIVIDGEDSNEAVDIEAAADSVEEGSPEEAPDVAADGAPGEDAIEAESDRMEAKVVAVPHPSLFEDDSDCGEISEEPAREADEGFGQEGEAPLSAEIEEPQGA